MRRRGDSSTASQPGTASSLGVLATRRKPLQDSPTPAGNPMAAIALARLASLHRRCRLSRQGGADAGDLRRRGGTVRNFRRDLRHCGRPFSGESGAGCGDCRRDSDDLAEELYAAAVAPFAFNKTTLRLAANQVVAENLPPVLAATIPDPSAASFRKVFRRAVLGIGLPASGLPTLRNYGSMLEIGATEARISSFPTKNKGWRVNMSPVSPKIASPLCSA